MNIRGFDCPISLLDELIFDIVVGILAQVVLYTEGPDSSWNISLSEPPNPRKGELFR